MSDDSQDWLGTALPLDDVDSNRVELAGRLAEYVQRLCGVVDRLTGAQPLESWVEVLREGIAQLTRVGPDEQWQQTQLDRELAKVLAHAGSRSGTTLRLPDVRSLLRRQLAGRPTRANFRTGTLTVCTMTPMRSVPHRVVCLLGLDDDVTVASGGLNPLAIAYLNRLSDLLFILARVANSGHDVMWVPGKDREPAGERARKHRARIEAAQQSDS